MMAKRITIVVIAFMCIVAITRAQSDDLPPITAENVDQLALIRTLPFPDAAEGFYAAAFSPDETQLALGRQGQLILISMADGTGLAEIEPGINLRPLNLYFSADGGYLAALDQEHFCVWDIRANVISLCKSLDITLPAGYSSLGYAMTLAAAFSPDSARLYVIAQHSDIGGVSHVYDLKAAREVDRIQIKNCSTDVNSPHPIEFVRGTTNFICSATYFGVQSTRQYATAVYAADGGRLVSSWTEDAANIRTQFARYLFGRRADTLDPETIPLNPPSAYPPNRHRKLFNRTRTLLAVIPLYYAGSTVELHGVVDCAAVATREVNLRMEPSTDALVGDVFLTGQRRALFDQTTSGGFTWWQTGDGLWLREDVAEIDCPR